MCTVSFSPNSRGFYLLMNRDEKRNRVTALPPKIVDLRNHRAIYPYESSGGTWIAANDAGVCLALINWHRIEREPVGEIVSRGRIISELAGKVDSAEIANGLTNLRLKEIRPFRLITIVLKEKAVTEWRWNLELLVECKHPWSSQHWFSSGFDEAKAEAVRRDICKKRSADSIEQLRALHRSHAPRRGPFSICMHRDDAATVSYTEVTVDDETVTMRYKPGSPCSDSPIVEKSL
jgi:Transport and Golgi organisation 2